MKRFQHGLVVGKFYPPHLGHDHLIRAALAECETLTVFVNDAASETIPAAERAKWLRATHPSPQIRFATAACDIPINYQDQPTWAAYIALVRAVLTEPVDAVFSSETYGDELARWLDAESVVVDLNRDLFGTSGTAIRDNLPGHWDFLAPSVRAGLTTRVVVLGSESTGTTTLSRALQERFRERGGVWADTQWIPEYGRRFTEDKLAHKRLFHPDAQVADLVWTHDDFESIAAEQQRLEDEAASADASSPLLICDTDAFATAVWEYRYTGKWLTLDWAVIQRKLHPRTIYLVTDHVGVPFEDDGWRDGEHIREQMTGWFVEALQTEGMSWTFLTGTLEERLHLAERTIDGILATHFSFGPPSNTYPVRHLPAHLRTAV
jgi:HTH-type transcriptional regulator, transcriptional repressor of NAD biosynthesis genes